MLFDRPDLYEVVSEGKKTNELNDIVKQYSQTIMSETDNQIKHVKKLKSVKESYISAAIENYIDTVLEDAINDDFFNRG